MTSNREGTMSNDKVAATGVILHYAGGLYRTACGADLTAEVLPTVLSPVNTTCPNCILALAARDMVNEQEDPQTTGEHVWGKLEDDLYQDFAPKVVANPDDGPNEARMYRRGLTPGEIGLAIGIVAFIIFLFLFIANTYR